MDNELHKIINGLEASAFERGMHQGFALGVIRVIQKMDAGIAKEAIISELIQEVPHYAIRQTIEGIESVDGGMDQVCCQIDELLTD